MIHLLGKKKVWQIQDRKANSEKKSSWKVRSEPLNETRFRATTGGGGKILRLG
jgi:hypothetical protein